MDFEWCPCPRSRLPSQLIHLINRDHCCLRCLSHQQRQRCQQLWQTLHTPFFRTNVPVAKSPIGVAFGILWNGGVFRVNVATLNRVALWVQQHASSSEARARRRGWSRSRQPTSQAHFGAGCAVQSEESRRVRGTVTLKKSPGKTSFAPLWLAQAWVFVFVRTTVAT